MEVKLCAKAIKIAFFLEGLKRAPELHLKRIFDYVTCILYLKEK